MVLKAEHVTLSAGYDIYAGLLLPLRTDEYFQTNIRAHLFLLYCLTFLGDDVAGSIPNSPSHGDLSQQ